MFTQLDSITNCRDILTTVVKVATRFVHIVMHFCAYAQLGVQKSSHHGNKVGAEWGGLEGIGRELSSLSDEISRLEDATDPQKASHTHLHTHTTHTRLLVHICAHVFTPKLCHETHDCVDGLPIALCCMSVHTYVRMYICMLTHVYTCLFVICVCVCPSVLSPGLLLLGGKVSSPQLVPPSGGPVLSAPDFLFKGEEGGLPCCVPPQCSHLGQDERQEPVSVGGGGVLVCGVVEAC